MTQSEINEMLKEHNEARRRDGADEFVLVSWVELHTQYYNVNTYECTIDQELADAAA